MERKIKEIRMALRNNMPECALALTLTLPDICGQIEYPTENVGRRYIKWLDSNISVDAFGNTNIPKEKLGLTRDVKLPFLDSKMIYTLRCHFLHSGDVNIARVDNNIDSFIFRKIGTNDFTDDAGIGVNAPITQWVEDGHYNTYEIDLDYFCNTIVDAAEKYYMRHNKKELFNEHLVRFI